MPRKKAAGQPVYPLGLTDRQREALVHATRLRPKIKDRIKDAPAGTQVVELTRRELDHMDDELSTAAVFAPDPYKKQLVAVQRKVFDLLEERSGDPEAVRLKGRRPADESDVLFQFRITLLGIEPPVWRRVQVEDGTLADLHEAIQAAFGWWDYHLHQFIVDGVRYGPPAPDGSDFGLEMEDETEVRLGGLLPKSGKRRRWLYEYDFGDGWRHEIMFEGYPPKEKGRKYPVCLDGARACPPEDVGGPWGYAAYLEALGDPGHEQHEELLEWRGPFDPEQFDAEEATREMRRPDG